jgi:hypothetical protein
LVDQWFSTVTTYKLFKEAPGPICNYDGLRAPRQSWATFTFILNCKLHRGRILACLSTIVFLAHKKGVNERECVQVSGSSSAPM